MAISLTDLIGALPQNLSNEILSPEQKAARVAEMSSAQMPDILRQYGLMGQNEAEGNFGRGMGISDWNASQLLNIARMQTEATNKGRVGAQSAVDAAQRAALGNAVSYATAEQNRQAQAQQAKAGRNQATTLQNRNMLYGGLGSLASGVVGTAGRDLMRPGGEPSRLGMAADRAKGVLGFGGGGEQKGETSPYPSLSQPEGTAPSTPNTGGYEENFPSQSFDYSGTGGDWSGFNMPDLPSFNPQGMDLWGLINGTYNQGDLGF